jgi:quercetin dioxygenase-like cupin family protein
VSFAARVVTIGPGAARPYDPREWGGALVSVVRGEVELECPGGGRSRFRGGDLLWLAPLTLHALRNPGPEAVVLVAVTRAGGDR